MADTRTFADVDAATWAKLRDYGARTHGTTYDDSSPTEGRATTQTPVGTVEMSYSLDPDSSSVTYVIHRKPFLVPASMIWDGIAQTLSTLREA